MRKVRWIVGMGLLAVMAGGVAAQTRPVFDLGPTLEGLKGEGVERGAARVAGLPPEALGSVYVALERPEVTGEVRESLEKGAVGLAQRALAARRARDAAIDAAWMKRTGIEAYAQVGVHNRAWDRLAESALAQVDPRNGAATFGRFRAAIGAGCTDPLIRYYYVTRGVPTGAVSEEAGVAMLRAAVADFEKSGYSPGRKFVAEIRLVEMLMKLPEARSSGLAEIQARLKSGLEAFGGIGPERMSEPGINDLVFSMYRDLVSTGYERKKAFDGIDPVLRANFGETFLPYAFEATFYTDWAWDARGVGYAKTVKDDAWKPFQERLSEAEKAARAGFTVDPSDTLCANQMITVCIGEGLERADMEKWYFRAMTSYPGDKTACLAKLQYLLPRWYGSAAEALAFGRECVARGNGENTIPEVMVEAHGFLAQTAADPAAYYQQPGVWSDLKSAYEKMLADEGKYPQYHQQFLWLRGQYLSYACKCKQWADFLAMTKRFGNEFDMKEFGGSAMYAYYKKQAEKALEKSPL